jgi:hypothetical protein
MKDTLNYILEHIDNNQQQGIDLIQKVDNFYNNAWVKLIFVITILFTIVGVIIPLFIQWLQKKSLKASEDLLKNEIQNKINIAKDDMLKDFNVEIDEKFKKYEREIQITRAAANAKLFLAEGKVKLSMNYYDKALNDFISASLNCIESDNYPTLSDALKHISSDCLPFLSHEEIEDLKTRNNCDLNAFLENMIKIDDRLFFRDIIGEMRVTISKLPRAIKDKSTEQSKLPQS